jgi:hypothetical protein
VYVKQDELSDQQERLILGLERLNKQAELVTGLELEEGDV